MREIWKDIEGYEGLYQISNLGRIKSLDRSIERNDGEKRFFRGKILKLQPDKRGGYYQAVISKNSIHSIVKVHRLVALYFCKGYSKNLVVNHKDGNRQNNVYTNLEWVTQRYNIRHSVIVLGKKPGNGCGAEHVKSIPIYCKDNIGVVSHFAGIRDAARSLHIDSSSICKVLKGKLKMYHSLRFFYESTTPQK